jgi:excisionase family DNA binding protein
MSGLTAAQLLTADQVAARWQVPKAHVYRLAREGRLPTVRLGRYMRWQLQAIEDFEAGGGTGRDMASAVRPGAAANRNGERLPGSA